MNLEIKKNERTLIVKFDGELDHHEATEIREKIDKEISMNIIKNLIMDFENLSFMDSSGIGVIIGRYKLIQTLEGETCLINLNPRISRIVEISGLKKIIPIYNSLDEALKNMQG
jgi:stage II sporulation protein AA (anti-sigma F factor antagonist)